MFLPMLSRRARRLFKLAKMLARSDFQCAFVQISFCLIMYDVLATRLVRLQSAREKRLLQLPKQPTNMESLPDHLLAALRTGGLHTSATPTSRALVVPGKWRWQ
jgi:hypothetical protein